ncbi:MAG: PilW family protein [Gammaproteobacteria bacterium]
MNRQTGFSLIEIMIALLLGIIVVGGALTIYISTIRGSTDTLRSARLNHDLDSAMQLMINDIRRAGYWGGAVAGVNVGNNPPANPGNPFTIGPFTIGPFTTGTPNIQIPINSCIRYSYDADNSGAPDNGEYYGFKLDNGALKMRNSSAPDTTSDCTEAGTWFTFTDEDKVNVTGLTFSAASSQCQNTTTDITYPNQTCDSVVAAGLIVAGQQAVETRQIVINMTGTVLTDNAVTKTLTETVKVRNNRIFTQ